MKKNILGHMDPPKTRESLFKRLHVIPFLLCVILAVILWLVAVNVNAANDASDEKADASQKTSAAIETSVHEL